MNQEDIFITQIELIINNNLHKKDVIDEETFIKTQERLLIKLENKDSSRKD